MACKTLVGAANLHEEGDTCHPVRCGKAASLRDVEMELNLAVTGVLPVQDNLSRWTQRAISGRYCRPAFLLVD